MNIQGESLRKMKRTIIVWVVLIGFSGFCFYGYGYAMGRAEKITKADIIVYSKNINNAPEALWPDETMKEAFRCYWQIRFEGRWQETFLLEAPYFQEMTPENRYRMYIENTRKNTLIRIQVEDVKKEGEYLYMVRCVVFFKRSDGTEKNAHLQDRWVFAGGKYFHVIDDNLFFPGQQGRRPSGRIR